MGDQVVLKPQANLGPRVQLDAARTVAVLPLVYMPHQGARERQRRLRRLGVVA